MNIQNLLIQHFFLQVKKTFNARSYWAHHDAWKNSGRFEWLPSWENIPKHLHERPQLSHLNRLEVRNFGGYKLEI